MITASSIKKFIPAITITLFILDNDQLVNNDQQQQQQHLNDPAINNQLLQHQRQQQEFLLHYRQALARLQKEDPVAAAAMPGINATEIEEREKDIVEDMGRIIYSKRYQDLTHEYRYMIITLSTLVWL